MIRMRIDKDNPHLEDLLYMLSRAGKGTLPNTEKAVKEAALLIQGRWFRYATGERNLAGVIPLKRPNAGYARSIRTNQTGPFEHDIYSEAKIAELIENGTKELDMKTTHPYGPRSRMSKEGFPYVIIPFRWGTPENGNGERVGFGNNIITAGTYRKLLKKSFLQSSVTASPKTSRVKSPNYRGEMVGRAQYRDKDGNSTWGSRLSGADAAGTDEQKSRMNGMVRFENGYDKEGNIDRRYGGYFTFRVISAKQLITSPYSWIKPAMPARHVVQAVADETREEVNALVGAGIMEDVKA